MSKMTNKCFENHTKSKFSPGWYKRPLRKGRIPAPVGSGLIPADNCIQKFKKIFKILRNLFAHKNQYGASLSDTRKKSGLRINNDRIIIFIDG